MVSVGNVKKFAKSVLKACEATPELVSCKEDIKTLCSMLTDWAKGNYIHLSKRTAVITGLCIGYVIFPFDIIPDFVPVLGQIDDMAVICFMLKVLKREIGFYRIWLAAENSRDVVSEQ